MTIYWGNEPALAVLNRIAKRLPKPVRKKPPPKPKRLPPDVRYFDVRITGTDVLICNNWGPGKCSWQPCVHKRTDEERFRDALYFLPGAKPTDRKPWRCGFPIRAFKYALIQATKFTSRNYSRKFVAGCVHFGVPERYQGLVPLTYKRLLHRRDRVSIGSSRDKMTVFLHHRPEFVGWSCTFRAYYNASVISSEEVINLLSMAGFSIGVGEWRPEKYGDHGTFVVEAINDRGEKNRKVRIQKRKRIPA